VVGMVATAVAASAGRLGMRMLVLRAAL